MREPNDFAARLYDDQPLTPQVTPPEWMEDFKGDEQEECPCETCSGQDFQGIFEQLSGEAFYEEETKESKLADPEPDRPFFTRVVITTAWETVTFTRGDGFIMLQVNEGPSMVLFEGLEMDTLKNLLNLKRGE